MVGDKLHARLNEARLDLAVVALPVSEAALHEEPLFDEDFVLVRPAADAGLPVPRPEILRAFSPWWSRERASMRETTPVR